MPNIDVLYSAGAEHIGVVHCDSDTIILDIILPDDLEKAIDVMVSVAYVLQDTSKVTRVTSRCVRMTTNSPYDSFVFDEGKLWHKEDEE